MTRLFHFHTLSLVALCYLYTFIGVGAAPAADNAPLVKHLLELSQKRNGICLLPHGGELALDLVTGSDCLVVSQQPTTAKATALRAKADQAGLLGRRLYVAEAEVGTPVLADNYANVLLITDATEELLGKLDPQVILKVLTAHGGKAIVGLAKGSPGQLTKDALEAWSHGFGVPEATVVQDAFGLWAIVTKPQLPGAAEWTHRFFDAAFNPVTTDSAFTMPAMTQWLDTPYNHGTGAPRIAGGRLLCVMEGAYMSRPTVDVNYLIMRDAYNGQVLWKRDLGVQYAADYYLSSVVLTADAVYLLDMPHPTVLVLNPDTGAEMRRIDCSTLGKQVKWIAIRDHMLFAAGGDTDHTGGPWNGVFGAQHVKFLRENDAALHDAISVGNSRMIGAFDLKTGKGLWSHDEEKDCMPEFFLAVKDGRVFFMAREKYAGALDSMTGQVIWKSPEAAKSYQDNLYPQFAVGSGSLEVANNTLLFAAPGSARIALNEEDGKQLWVTPKYGGHQQCGSLIWDKYVLGQTSVDLRTGVLKWSGSGYPINKANDTDNPYRGACTFLCASQHYITGMPGATYDLQAMKQVTQPTYFHKAPCSMGSVIGEGMIFLSSFHCTCNYQLNGNIVEMSGAARQYQQPAVETERLRWSANPNPTMPLLPTAADWPVFRGHNERGNASTATVPARVATSWTYQLSTPYHNPSYPSDKSDTSNEPAQPLAVGNLVITSGPDGAVRAFDLASGIAKWVYYTGGAIAQSPAIADSRAYVPSGDGFLYCLEAVTGRELWRFRAAPAERRMMVYGHLVSTWPLFAGVLVQEGVVYTAASLLNDDATHVYALDAKTGHIMWQNNTSGLPKDKSEDGVTAVGTLTVAQGRLWLRTTSYDLKTGECQPSANSLMERYTGVVQGKYLLFGGRRYYESQSRPLTIGRSPAALSMLELNAEGKGIAKQIEFSDYTESFAAWDDRQMIATPVLDDHTSINGALKHAPILCWDLAKTLTEAQAERADKVAKIVDYPSMLKWNSAKQSKFSWEHVGELPMGQWMLETHRTYAVALAANVVLATYGIMEDPDQHIFRTYNNVVPTKWFATALDRTTGKELWKQPLPSEPVLDGLCIAHDGSVIVQLLNGSVLCIAKNDTPPRQLATVLATNDPRSGLFHHLGAEVTPIDNVPTALADPTRVAVIDATPSNLTALAINLPRLRAFTAAGGNVVLWGVTPDGLADFNKIVGVEHLIRPFTMEKVTTVAADVVTRKLALYPLPVDMEGGDRNPGGAMWPAADTFTYVVDAGTDIAPFAHNSRVEQLPAAQRNDPASMHGDHSPWNLTNGFTSHDGWWYAYMFDPQDKTKNTVTFTWPTAQILARLSIQPNVTYRKPSRVKVTFDGAGDPLMVLLKPEAARQHFDLGGRKATSLTLEVVECVNADDSKHPSVTGIDNLWVDVIRPPVFTQTVHSVFNVGGLVYYPMGKGQLIMLQLNVPTQETNPSNTEKKATILHSLLDSLSVDMTAKPI